MDIIETTPVEALVDRISTAELLKRYELKSRTGLSNRLDALGISTQKEGKQFYVSLGSLESLDALHECLKQGRKLKECAALLSSGLSFPGRQDIVEYQPEPTTLTLSAIASAHPDPLVQYQLLEARYELLTKAAEKDWSLPTSELLSVLGLRSIPKLENGEFKRRGFVFVRYGKSGREIEWKIEKI